MPSNSVDLILTDPPYGMSFRSRRRKTQFDKIAGDQSCEVFLQALPDVVRVLKPDRHFYAFCSWHHIDVFKAAIDQHLTVKNILVWVKNCHGSGDLKGSWAPQHEFIIFAHKGRRQLFGKRLPDVIQCPKIQGRDLRHPTEKPIDLLAKMIHASTEAGEIVFDPFCGAGSTNVAAAVAGRGSIGLECDARYVEIALRRLSFRP